MEFLEDGSWWFHLRRCAACGHIGCCGSSPEQHARSHAEQTDHQIIRTFEPGENWFWDYAIASYVDGPELAAPAHRPIEQAIPGPDDVVPADWKSLLRR